MNLKNKNAAAENSSEKNRGFFAKKNWPIFVLGFSAFFSVFAWGVVLNKTSPFVSPQISILLFYISFFFAVASSFALVSTLLAATFSPRHSPNFIANVAIRQGLILAAIFVVGLIFQQFRVLTWYSTALLLGIGIFIEIAFLPSNKNEF